MSFYPDLIFFREIEKHALEHPDEEVCGVVLRRNNALTAIRIQNDAADRSKHFRLNADEYLSLHTEVLAVYHSHPTTGLKFSDHDIVASEECAVPYLLYAEGDMVGYVPQQCRAKLEGRPYLPLIYDCLTLCSHYIEKHWQTPATLFQDRSLHNTAAQITAYITEALQKYRRVERPAVGDVAIISITGGRISHAGIIAEDGILLHQLNSSVSRRDLLKNWESRILYYIRKQ